MPSPVPDYQVPHCHNTDEFYYFIGNNADLTGLEGQIIFEGKVHKIISPACVYIPTGAVHEYKVTRGAGTVTVLFRNRGYTHEDKLLRCRQGRARFRQVCRLYFASRRAADDVKLNITATRRPACAMFLSTVSSSRRRVFTRWCAAWPTCKPTQANYVEQHTHNCDTQHIAIGKGAGIDRAQNRVPDPRRESRGRESRGRAYPGGNAALPAHRRRLRPLLQLRAQEPITTTGWFEGVIDGRIETHRRKRFIRRWQSGLGGLRSA